MINFRIVNGKLRLRNGKLALPGTAVSGGGSGSATALTVAEVADKSGQIIQRAPGATTKTVAVSGTYTGAPALVQVRFVPRGGLPSAWVSLAANPTGGVFSGSYACPQSLMQGDVQVRCSNATGVTATTTRRFAVGVIVLVAGQSNTRNLSQEEGTYPLASLDNSRYTDASNTWGRHGNHDLTETYPPNTPFSTYGGTRTDITPRGDGIVFFVNYMSAALGCAVGTIETAVSGSTLAQWTPGGGLWNATIAALNEIGGDCEVMHFGQGEESASASMAQATWEAGADAMLAAMLTQTGRTTSTFKMGLATLGPTDGYGPEGSFGTIRRAQLSRAALPGFYLAGNAIDLPLGDSVHTSVAGLAVLGKRFAKAGAAALAGAPKAGPKIASATRSGAVITVTITGGTGALVDGAGGSGAALSGIRVYDGGVLATISSTAISGSNIVITLAATPAGAVTLDYGMANAPHGTNPAANAVLYDSDTVPGHTRGLPLQPCAAITVTGA